MRNVEEVRTVRFDSFVAQKTPRSLSRARTQDNTTRQAAVGVLSLRRAPKLGKLLVCLASICSSCDLRPPAEPKGARSAGPIGVRGSVSPTSLARQVGGVEIV